MTLAIETSCDDTCVAILDKDVRGIAHLYFNEKITSDNRAFRGVHPLNAVVSHTMHLAPLIQEALRALPKVDAIDKVNSADEGRLILVDGHARLRPDFVSVTRGPGMASNLATGLNMAKGLAVAWNVPLVAVNHMQAHALTPRLVRALEKPEPEPEPKPTGDPKKDHEARLRIHENQNKRRPESPQFPFLSLLVSGGHTMLVHSRSLTDHAILAESLNIAVGDMLDKCARMILPLEILSAADSNSGMYGPMLEEFTFPGSTTNLDSKTGGRPEDSMCYDYDYTPPARRADEVGSFDSGLGWTLTPPLARMGQGKEAASTYEFAGLNGQVQKLMLARPDMGIDERRVLARAAMRLVFEHLASRVLFALQDNKKGAPGTEAEGQSKIKTVVLSGGVASNKFLRHIVRAMLDARGHTDVEVIAPPVSLCTDNAAMIAWTGIEMYEQGWRSTLDVLVKRKWSLDPNAEDGGILGGPNGVKTPKTGP
ncbi:glycoprotease pgp1 [Xylariaceae sp. AK1471]|nr:glycoprotease pgp1 [Xylariaceae sp. AK1471]